MIEPKLKPPFRYNFAWEDHDFVYCATAKCASQSMRQMLRLPARNEKPHIRSLEQSWQYTTRFAIFRHPFSRLVSAWRYAWRSSSWERFVTHVLQDPNWDIHTAPQYDWLSVTPGELGTFVPNVIVTLESLGRHWDRIRDEHMPWAASETTQKNISPPLDYPPEKFRAEIEAAPGYAQDLKFWEHLTNECDGYLGPSVDSEAGGIREPGAARR